MIQSIFVIVFICVVLAVAVGACWLTRRYENNASKVDVVAVIMHTILLAALIFFLYYIVPRIEKTYADFEVELPAITHRLINCSSWFISSVGRGLLPVVIIPVVLIGFGAGNLFLHHIIFRGKRIAKRGWSLTFVTGFLVLMDLMILAAYLPFNKITVEI